MVPRPWCGKAPAAAAARRVQCGDVELDDVVDRFEVVIGEFAVGGDAGVVDQQRDLRIVRQFLLDLSQVDVIRQVGLQHLDLAARRGREAVGQLLQLLAVAGDDDEIVAALGEAVGVDGPIPVEAPVTSAVPDQR